MTNEMPDTASQSEEVSAKDAGAKSVNKGRIKGRFAFPDFTIFLWGWFFLSLALLMAIGWNYLQDRVYDQGVRTGAQNTAAQIYTDMINKAANDKCNTIFVQYENRRVDLINVRCLQLLNQNEAAQKQAEPATKE